MDIKMMLDPDDSMRRDLESLGIRDNQDSEYEIRRRDTGMRFLPGHREDQQFYVCVDDIFFIESMGHDVLIHPDKFLRVSNSTIVNLKQVKRIESSLMQKFILHMSNGARIDVTRSYYYIFRDRLGI